MTPIKFTNLRSMREQECDRPKALAIELAKVAGTCIVVTPDYDTMYVWPLNADVSIIAQWHAQNNPGETLIFHLEKTQFTATMP